MTGSMRRWFGTMALAMMVFALGACSVNVDKGANGEEKKVDIRTPLGSINVRNDNVTAKDTGFSVYPGAQETPRTEHNDNKANVNIDTPLFGVKVAALTYTTQDDPQKVLSYYRDQIKGYGNFVECKGPQHGSGDSHASKDDLNKPVSCDGSIQVNDQDSSTTFSDAKSIVLKTGTNGNQHVVAVKPKDKGTEFSLVYVRVHAGKEDSI